MKKHILILIDTAFIGGPGKGVLQLARQLRDSDYHCTVACFSYKNPKSEEFIQAVRRQNTPLLLLPQSSLLDMRPLLQLQQFIHENNVAVIQTHGYKGHFFAVFLSRFALRLADSHSNTRPLAVCLGVIRDICLSLATTVGLRKSPKKGNSLAWLALTHGWTHESWRTRVYRHIERFLLRFADCVATVSLPLQSELSQLRKDSVALIENAIETIESPPDSHFDRKTLGLSPNTQLFVFAGRLSREKGAKELLEAWRNFPAREHDCALLLAGDGSEKTALKEFVIRHKLQEHVLFLGYRSDLLDILTAADVLVIPSLSEGLPNVLLEAMASRTVVVATQVGMIPEILKDKKTGFLIPPADPSALQQALREASTIASGTREAMLSEAYSLVSQRFSATKRANRFIKLYDQLVRTAHGTRDDSVVRSEKCLEQ